MRALVAAALVLGFACGDSRGSLGDECKKNYDCGKGLDCHEGRCRSYWAREGEVCSDKKPYRFCRSKAKGTRLLCFNNRCVRQGKRGEACSRDLNNYRSCVAGLFCTEGRCGTYDDLQAAKKRRKAADEARKREADLLAKKRMLEEAGAKPPPVEKSEAQPDSEQRPQRRRTDGHAIRVVEIEHKGFALAACKGDERLVGGGCDGGSMVSNRPTAFGPDDTIGARWRCQAAKRSIPVKAFALCAKLGR